MDARSDFGAARVLCVEPDEAVLESGCAILKNSGYDAASASPRLAEIVLRSRKVDLIVVSSLGDFALHRIIGLSDGAEVLVLDGFILPSELLSLVEQRLSLREKTPRRESDA
jgi:hypothetical protein